MYVVQSWNFHVEAPGWYFDPLWQGVRGSQKANPTFFGYFTSFRSDLNHDIICNKQVLRESTPLKNAHFDPFWPILGVFTPF